MSCARCGKAFPLKPEVYEGVEIDRCPKCKGIWLDDKEIAKIVSARDEVFSPSLIEETIKGAFAGVTDNENTTSEHCPRCDALMLPLNYSYSSGVIIDRCPAHGIWLDHLELEKLQAHAEHWEKEKEARQGEWIKLCEATRDQHMAERVAWEKKQKISPIAKILQDIADWV